MFMMKLELLRLHSPDTLNLQYYEPEYPDCFCILVQAIVGLKGKPGEESFDFLVCTPNWLASKVSEAGYVFGRHYLFLLRYDYNLILQAIEKLCAQAEGQDWETIANYLGRYGKWEFEDYKE